MKTCTHCVLVLLALLALNSQLSTVFAQGTAFTYQGQLQNNGNPASGTYNLTFSLFNTNTSGVAIAGPVTNNAVVVTNGLFTVLIDFGPGVFTGTNYWLQIGVETNGVSSFTTLTPRQQLTPTPYAIYAEGASNMFGVVPSGGLSGSYSSAVTLNNSANSFNGSYTGNGRGLTNLNVATLGGLTSSNLWQLGGNNVAPGQFLGSTNNQPVEIWANNQRVAQLAYASNAASGYSPNVVLGNGVNFVSNGVVGATIVGGGVANGSYTPSTNQVLADFGTVVGGYGNIASGKYSVAMGFRAVASGSQSIALGGASATGDYSTAAGNSGAGGKFSTAMGSSDANLEGDTAMGISTASGGNSTAMGTSQASGSSSTAMGFSAASGNYSTAMGYSSAGADYSTAMGSSTASGYGSTALGNDSAAITTYSTAMGQSTAHGTASTAMGISSASGNYSTAMGQSITTNDDDTAMGASTAGGFASTAMGQSTASGFGSTAMGLSTASGGASTAMGLSIASGNYSAALGLSNSASGGTSFAAGNRAKANNNGDFVWADSQSSDFNSTANDQFCIRAQGGVQLDNSTSMFFGNQTRQMLNLYGTGYGIGVQNYVTYFRSGEAFAWFQGGAHSDTSLDPGAGGTLLMELDIAGDLFVHGSVEATTFYSASDRNLKAGFEPVAAKSILEKVAGLPIARWHFTNDVATTHLGPMAQDFYTAFGVGPDDKHIATVDEGGVALAAIQGLNQKLNEKDAEIQTLKRQNDSLARELNELETAVKSLAEKK